LVLDQSGSIRSLLRRTIDDADGLVCSASHTVTAFVDGEVDLEGIDAVVLGLKSAETETGPGLEDRLIRAGKPVVILRAAGSPFPISEWRLEACRFLEKPQSPAGWESLRSILVAALKGLGNPGVVEPGKMDSVTPRPAGTGLNLIVVGGSAGAPDATGEMLKAVGTSLQKTTVVIVQHISEGFESGYVDWLSRILSWVDVGIGGDGEPLLPGRIRLAGPGGHLQISKGAILRTDLKSSPRHGHRPSIDHLFQSLARWEPRGSAGVLLSGMGIDGVEGLLSLKRVGCPTLVQDEASSTVFGMPRVALERGAASMALSPEALGRVLREMIDGEPRP
jgi:two-component system chemotaxis response regulator CheB